ncbi:MAG: hypothetical protein JRF63_03165 [Deltaproteobacteria bacterium]|nr:hypothetical protein [Deltaproteobacteria bacterium]
MRTALETASIALFLVASSVAADDGDPAPGGIGVVVWIASPGENVHFLRKAAPPVIEELGVTVIVEEAGEPPTLTHALETLAVHHALAVVWHGEGYLQVLFAGEGAEERLKTRAGPPQEEALYVRDVLVARVEEGGALFSEILVTVPGELVERPEPPPLGEVHVEVNVIGPRSVRPLSGGRLGIGYVMRSHFDEVSWRQHALSIHVPAWRFEQGLMVRLMVAVGLPASFGDADVDRLELRSIGGVAGAAWIPFEQRWFEIEIGGGAGFEHTTAVAFFENGKTESAKHVAGQLAVWFGLVWHPTPGLDVRLHLNGAYVFRPPSFGIDAGGDSSNDVKGDFGSFPWQPGVGIDVAGVLF